MSAALRSVGLLDVLVKYVSGALGRAPCIHARLHRLATNLGEKCGLAAPRAVVVLAAAGIALFAGSELSAHPNARFYRGDITVASAWEGVIRLTGTVVILEGATVTVDPGTEILVQPDTGADIVVRGRLLVRGTAGRPVLFDTAGGCAAGRWGGIVFERGATGILEHVRIRCSSTGIRGELDGVARTAVAVDP